MMYFQRFLEDGWTPIHSHVDLKVLFLNDPLRAVFVHCRFHVT